jgi:hypothetical protein
LLQTTGAIFGSDKHARLLVTTSQNSTVSFPGAVALMDSSNDDSVDDCRAEIPVRTRRGYAPLFRDESVLGKRSHSESFVPPPDGQPLYLSPSLNEVPPSLTPHQSEEWAVGPLARTNMPVRSPAGSAPVQSAATGGERRVAPRQPHMMQNLSTSESTPTPGNETEVAPLEPSKKELVSLTQSVLQTACKRAVVS